MRRIVTGMSIPATIPSRRVVGDVSSPVAPPGSAAPIGSSCGTNERARVCMTISTSSGLRSRSSRSSTASPLSAVGRPGDDEQVVAQQPPHALAEIGRRSERDRVDVAFEIGGGDGLEMLAPADAGVARAARDALRQQPRLDLRERRAGALERLRPAEDEAAAVAPDDELELRWRARVVDVDRRPRAGGDVEQRLLRRVAALGRADEPDREPRALRETVEHRVGVVVAAVRQERQHRARRARVGGRRDGEAGEREQERDHGKRAAAEGRGWPSPLPILSDRARAPFREVHVPEARPRLAAPARRRAPRPQARVRRRLRRLRRRSPAAAVLDGRHARRRRSHAAVAGAEPRPHPRVPRRAGAERADEVGLDPPLLPRDDEGVGVLRRVAPGGPPGAREVPVRLPVRQDAGVVRAGRQGALADHAGAHQARQGVSGHRPQHVVLVRPRRPGVRRRLRDRRSRARSSTSCSACARPSRRCTPRATRRRSRASARPSSGRWPRSTASRSRPR